MPQKLRKTRKKRGTRTVGWGRVGQHRKSGQKGRKKAGRRKHLKSYVLRYEPEYFQKKGFSALPSEKINVVNIGQLEELAMQLTVEKNLKKDELVLLDLASFGYYKLLGMGSITKPFSIKVASYSESAARKIKEAGGKLITEVE